MSTADLLLKEFGKKYSIDGSPQQIGELIISTCIGEAMTCEQMTAFLIVAKQYDLNPFTKEIYGSTSQQGRVLPIVGVDGWTKLVNEQPTYDGVEFSYNDEDKSCTCSIYRTDRTRPTVITEYHDECVADTESWKKKPKRMLRHKSLIQCARIAFSFSGIYDPDEAAAYLQDEAKYSKKAKQANVVEEAKEVPQVNQQTEAIVEAEEVKTSEPTQLELSENSLPPMDESRFNRNLRKARQILLEGKTVEGLLETMSVSYALSDTQIQAFKDLAQEIEQEQVTA